MHESPQQPPRPIIPRPTRAPNEAAEADATARVSASNAPSRAAVNAAGAITTNPAGVPVAVNPASAADEGLDAHATGDGAAPEGSIETGERRSGERRDSVDRRSGFDRRRGPGIRRTVYRRAAEEGEMTEEQFAFIRAMDEYKRVNHRPYPTWTEILDVVLYLGYRKIAECGEHALTKARPRPGDADDDAPAEL